MLIYRAHKILLRPNKAQANYFARACGVARLAYNWGLTEWKRQYVAGDKPNALGLSKKFNSIKARDFPFVYEVTKCAPQAAFFDLGTAFRNFFRNIRAGKKPGYPRYKRRGVRDSFYLSNDRVTLDGKRVRVPKLGWVRMRESLRFGGKIMSATVSRTADKWFISVNVEQDASIPKPEGPAIGVDVGIKMLAVVSDGRTFENPKALRTAESRLRLYQKSVSRKQRGSNNRKKAVVKLARQYYRIANIRKDALHKATTAITKGCSRVGIEDLNVSGMLKNRCLSKALSDAALSEFLRQIEYKAEWRGVKVVKADKFFPSSKLCSECGCVKESLSLDERIYQCEHCGVELDRDLNAAMNLREMAVGSTVTACRLGGSGSEVGAKPLIGQEFPVSLDWAQLEGRNSPFGSCSGHELLAIQLETGRPRKAAPQSLGRQMR